MLRAVGRENLVIKGYLKALIQQQLSISCNSQLFNTPQIYVNFLGLHSNS